MLGFTGKITLDLSFIGRERIRCLELMGTTNVCVSYTQQSRTAFYFHLVYSQNEGTLETSFHFQK